MRGGIKLQVKNLHFKDLQVLLLELDIYNKYVAVNDLANNFLDTIITFDIIMVLSYILNDRIEKPQTEHTLSFSVTQSAIIIKCCNFNRTDRELYTKHVMNKLKIDLDKQLNDMV